MLDWENGDISTGKFEKIVVPLFCAAFAALNKGTTILYWFYTDLDLYQQC